MRRLFLVILTLAVCVAAQAQTPNLNVLRMNGGIKPALQLNFTTANVANPNVSGVGCPTFQSCVTFSRASNAMMMDSTGALTFAPNNLLFPTTGWGTQTVTVASGTNFILSFNVASTATITGSSGCVFSAVGGSAGAYTKTFTSTGTSCILTLGGSGGVTNPILAQVTYETTPRPMDALYCATTTSAACYGPRVNDWTSGIANGFLLEEQRTNLAQNNLNMAASPWASSTSGSGTVSATAASGTSPDGTTNATLITVQRSSALDGATRYQSFLGTAAVYSGDLFVKAYAAGDVGKTIYIQPYNGSSVGVSGSVALSASWQKLPASATMAASASCNFSIGLPGGIGSQTGTVNFLAAYANFELGAFNTSPIPTPTSSTVTRAADVAQATGPLLTTLRGDGWSFFTGFKLESLPVGGGTSLLVAGTLPYDTPLYATATPSVGSYSVAYGGLTIGGGLVVNTLYEAAVATNSSGRSITYNGISPVMDSNKVFVSSQPQLTINAGNRWVPSIAVCNRRVTNSTLKADTILGAPIRCAP